MQAQQPFIVFRLEIDPTILREVVREAREVVQEPNQTLWGNALEKAYEELKVGRLVEIHVDDQGNILGLIYPPYERIGVTYYVEGGRCQCEAWNEPCDHNDPASPPKKQPCRHRAKLRLIERVADRGGAHPVRIVQGG